MRIYWWQAGLHMQPESKEDHEALVSYYHMLERVKLGHVREKVPAYRGRGKESDKENVVVIEDTTKAVK